MFNKITLKSILSKKYEILFILLPIISLLTSAIIISSKKLFWNDELLSFYLLNDPSFVSMMAAVSDRINQSPPLYFVLGWLWVQLFGSTELSLGLFSSLTIIITLCLVWIVLRHTYSFWSTAVGVIVVFCLSPLVLTHNTEVRMYGLFAAACAFAFFQYDFICRRQNLSWKILTVNSIAHAAIVLTHLYGVFYSAAILAAFMINDRKRGIFQANVYFSICIGWASLIPFLPYLLYQSISYNWFYPFPFSRLLRMLLPFAISKFNLFLICMVIIISISLRRIVRIKFYGDRFFIRKNHQTQNNKLFVPRLFASREVHLLLFAALFMLVTIVPWLINSTIKQILSAGNSRYFIPTIILSWAIFITYVTSKILPITEVHESEKIDLNKRLFSYRKLQSFVLASFVAILIITPITRAQNISNPVNPGENDLTYGYPYLPIAVEAGHDFLPRFHYSSNPNRYFHILDWETVLKNTDGIIATGDYIILEALNRNYPFIQSIQSDKFLSDNQQFLVLNDQDQKWFEERIENNPNFITEKIGSTQGAYGGLLEVFLVSRK